MTSGGAERVQVHHRPGLAVEAGDVGVGPEVGAELDRPAGGVAHDEAQLAVGARRRGLGDRHRDRPVLGGGVARVARREGERAAQHDVVAVAALVDGDELRDDPVATGVGHVEGRRPAAVLVAGGVQVAEDGQVVVDDVEVQLLGELLDVVGDRLALVVVDAEAQLTDAVGPLAHLQAGERVADLADAGAVADGQRRVALARRVGVARLDLAVVVALPRAAPRQQGAGQREREGVPDDGLHAHDPASRRPAGFARSRLGSSGVPAGD